jgi:hypothetical protein
MRALILNGAVADDDPTNAVGDVLAEAFERSGWQVDAIALRDVEIAGCLGCFGCWDRTPGVCVIDDVARDISRRVIQSDLTTLLTPVTFGGYSSQLKKALDRIICIVHPDFLKVAGEVHHKKRYDRYPSLLGVGVLPRPDEESEQIFKALIYRNSINIHSPVQAAGVVHGDQPDDEVRGRITALLGKVGVQS